MSIAAKGDVLGPLQTCCVVRSLCRIGDFSCLLHKGEVETNDMNMRNSFTLLRATFLPKMKLW